MDAVIFLNAYNRMCNSVICDECDLFDEETLGCAMQRDSIKAKEIVAKVERWLEKNPVKTRRDVFLEQYPEAKINNDGSLAVYPCTVSAAHRDKYGHCAISGMSCFDCQREFWMQEVE